MFNRELKSRLSNLMGEYFRRSFGNERFQMGIVSAEEFTVRGSSTDVQLFSLKGETRTNLNELIYDQKCKGAVGE